MKAWGIETYNLRSILRKCLLFLGVFILTLNSYANPVLNNVSAGNVSIQQAPQSTVVNQTSDKAIINWHSFNIGKQETTHFQQPSGGVALNRISPTQGVSQIYGTLTATGRIILINPAGIYFGSSAHVNVGGIIATTANMTDENFLQGNYQFSKVDGYSGSVINQGTIVAAEHGLVALVAPGVVNNGMITANLGHVVLASGEAFTMNFSGNDLVNFAVTQKTSSAGVDKDGNRLRDGVKNTGQIYADGGRVQVTAQAAQGVLDNVINMEGIVQAKSVGIKKGEIILGGDTKSGVVRVAAKINASGKAAGEKGGKVVITGYNILLDSPTLIDVSGDTGGGEVYVGGNYRGQGPLPNANALVMAPDAKIYADTLTQGRGGDVILWSDQATQFYGSIYARGGSLSGPGGFVETSGKEYLKATGSVNASAFFGEPGVWLLDPRNVTIAAATVGGAFDGGSPNVFTPVADDATVDSATINASLNGGTSVTITTGATGAQVGNITVANAISKTAGGNATLTLTAAPLTGSIAVNAAITATVGLLDIVLNAANVISITAPISTGGNVTLTTNGDISETGAGAITANELETNSNSGTITLLGNNNVDLFRADSNVAGTINLNNTGALTVGAIVSGGDVTITNNGPITQLTDAASDMIVSVVTVTLNAGANPISFNNPGNQIDNSTIIFSNSGANDVTATIGANTEFGTSTIGGNLVMTLNGNTGQVGSLTVGGTSSFTTTNLSSVLLLTNAGNNFGGAVSIDTSSGVQNTAITNNGALTLGTISAGNGFTVNATSITQAGALSVPGTATLNANTISLGGGAFTVNNLSVVGTGGNATLAVNTGGTQTWNLTAADAGTLTGIAGIAGTFSYNNIQNLTGGTGDDNYVFNEGSLAGSVNGGGGNNTIFADDVSNIWNVTSSNGGSVTGIGGSFSNIQNLTGGTVSDAFFLSGGTLSGNIEGNAGTNSLAGNNTANVWNITGTNTGTVTGVGGTFNNIQNLTGGSSNNDFIFANNALVTGTIDGGSLNSLNTLNYLAYTTIVQGALNPSLFEGTILNNGSTITTFRDINNLIANGNNVNVLTLPNKNNNVVTITGINQGFINDPLNFSGFNFLVSLSGTDTVLFNVPAIVDIANRTAIINGVLMTFVGFNFSTASPSVNPLDVNVSQIIQQPDSNAVKNPNDQWLLISEELNENLNQLIADITTAYNESLNRTKINPYCAGNF